MSEDKRGQKAKRAAIVILISLKREAKNKSTKAVATEIRKVLEKSLVTIPWLVLENVVVVEA